MNHPPCILCGNAQTAFYYDDNFRTYLQCPLCKLVFVPPHQRLSPDEEKDRYLLHENDPSNNGYRTFLSRLFEPMNKLIPPHSQGLDFGSGPGPTLHLMFEEVGHQMDIFDPFFADDDIVFNRTYDFITATEVVEHLYSPLQELQKLWSCLKSGGYLGLMTKLVKNREAFADWHYIRDDTHIAFFSRPTFEWLADQWNTSARFIGDDVIIFQKP